MRTPHPGAPLALVLYLVLQAACAPPAQLRYERELSSSTVQGQHAVHNERLEELMRGLDRLMSERLPQSMDLSGGRDMRLGEIAAVARSLADSADLIAETAGELGLEGEEEAAFLQLASELRARASQLGLADASLSPSELRDRIQSVQQTCQACHGRFGVEGALSSSSDD